MISGSIALEQNPLHSRKNAMEKTMIGLFIESHQREAVALAQMATMLMAAEHGCKESAFTSERIDGCLDLSERILKRSSARIAQHHGYKNHPDYVQP